MVKARHNSQLQVLTVPPTSPGVVIQSDSAPSPRGRLAISGDVFSCHTFEQ